MTTSETYRAALAPLTDVVEGVADWDAPAPCDGWTAHDVLHHVVTTQRALLADRGVALAPAPDGSL